MGNKFSGKSSSESNTKNTVKTTPIVTDNYNGYTPNTHDDIYNSTESTHFESSFWPTMTSTLFNDKTVRTDGIDCGIIFIPKHNPIQSILNSTFKGCIKIKAPATQLLLKYYGRPTKQQNSYIIIHCGYIVAYNVYVEDVKKNNKNQTIYSIASENNYIIIDSEKKQTKRSGNTYYRIYVNNERCKSSDDFCLELKKQGIDINPKTTDKTLTYKSRSSLDISSTFANKSLEALTAETLSRCISYLQSKRTKEDPIGATIVVIPHNKTIKDFKPYLKQYEPVHMQLTEDMLFRIFTHSSELHDGAIFIKGDTIIAVKAFFQITGKTKKKALIRHGTRHTSAKEFSKHSKMHKSITFVLSEEDGKIRACIDGKLVKVTNKKIKSLILDRYYPKINAAENKEECEDKEGCDDDDDDESDEGQDDEKNFTENDEGSMKNKSRGELLEIIEKQRRKIEELSEQLAVNQPMINKHLSVPIEINNHKNNNNNNNNNNKSPTPSIEQKYSVGSI